MKGKPSVEELLKYPLKTEGWRKKFFCRKMLLQLNGWQEQGLVLYIREN